MMQPNSTLDDDEIVLTLLAVCAWPALVAGAVWGWSRGTGWLIAHKIVVAASENPLVVIPATGGAGLDLQRVAVVAGFGVLMLAFTFHQVRAAVRSGRVIR